MKSLVRMFVMAGMIGALAATCYAADKPMDAKMSPEQEKMMMQIKERTTPGVAHQVLKPLAGNWTYTSTFLMEPNGKPESTTGTAKHTLIYGDRFIKQEIAGNWMGEAFEGTGYIGYDNVKAKYVSTWMDSMMTGIMVETGDYDTATKTLKFAGKNSCPMTGETDRSCRSDLTIVDAGHITYTAYGNDPKTGKEFKAMEIIYVRA